jgi:peptide/nickel transport system permease protein
MSGTQRRRLASRLLAMVPLLLGVSVITFALVRLVPGDTVTAILGPRHGPEEAARLRTELGLDRPLPVQYLVWLARVVRGDLGASSLTGTPVLGAIGERLPVTFELSLLSVGFALFLGVPLGAFAAVRRSAFVGRAAGTVGLVGISIPGFWLGTVLVLFFSLGLRALPSSGFVPVELANPESLRANVAHLVLPAVALGGAVAGVVLRTTRAAVLEVLGQDHVRVARAKGLSPVAIVVRHALRPVAAPILTVLGVQAGYLLAGSIVIEQVFALPGLGRLTFQALGNRDYPLFQGCVLVLSASWILVALVVDLVVPRLDPRLR